MKIREMEVVYRATTREMIGHSVTTPQDALSLFRHLEDATVEKMLCLYLDTKGKALTYEVIGIGNLAICVVSPRTILRSALLLNASSVLLAHNHPSGDPTPSREDKQMTQSIKDACALLEIKMLDHIIIGKDAAWSMEGKGLIL